MPEQIQAHGAHGGISLRKLCQYITSIKRLHKDVRCPCQHEFSLRMLIGVACEPNHLDGEQAQLVPQCVHDRRALHTWHAVVNTNQGKLRGQRIIFGRCQSRHCWQRCRRHCGRRTACKLENIGDALHASRAAVDSALATHAVSVPSHHLLAHTLNQDIIVDDKDMGRFAHWGYVSRSYSKGWRHRRWSQCARQRSDGQRGGAVCDDEHSVPCGNF